MGTKISDLQSRHIIQDTDYLVIADKDENLNYKISITDLKIHLGIIVLLIQYNSNTPYTTASYSYNGVYIP